MTRKKCIKMIMGTMRLPQPRGAEMVFRCMQEKLYKRDGSQPSNKEVLVDLLFEIGEAGPGCGVSVLGSLLAIFSLSIIEIKTAIIHDRLMGGPAKETQA